VDGETGQLVWSEIYSTLYNERIVAAAADSEGNLYVVGRAFGTGFYDIYVQKYAAENGINQWSREIAGDSMLDDVGWDIAVDSQDRPVVCGLVGTSLSEADVVTVVYEPEMGTEAWRSHRSGAVYNIEALMGWVAVADNDDVIMVSRTWSSDTGFDIILTRYDSIDGSVVYDEQWNSSGTTADDPRAMLLDTAGDIIVAGVSDGDYMVAKFDGTDGQFIWNAAYAGPPDWYDVANCMALAPDGTIIASGFSDGSGTGWDVATIAVDPDDGMVLWDVRFDGYNESDEARSVAVGPTGDIVVTGYCYNYDSGNDLLTVFYDAATVSAVPGQVEVPMVAALTEAWPNPFNPRVNISFALPVAGNARVSVHDLRGRVVAVLSDERLDAGAHTVSWDGRDGSGRSQASGLYFAVLQTVDGRSSKKLTLTK